MARMATVTVKLYERRNEVLVISTMRMIHSARANAARQRRRELIPGAVVRVSSRFWEQVAQDYTRALDDLIRKATGRAVIRTAKIGVGPVTPPGKAFGVAMNVLKGSPR